MSTGSGKYTEEFFVQRIQHLQDAITSQLPSIDAIQKETFLTSCESVQSSIQAKVEAQKLLDALKKAQSPKDMIEKATDLVKACEDAQANAEDTFAASARPILERLHLASSIDEAVLLECTILVQSTPKALASWVIEDEATNERLLDSFLGNVDWMKQMILGGGASNGNYGPAIAIHSTLLLQMAADEHPATPQRHKVALATALEHATPIPIFKDEHNHIDPLGRFWHYVHAYENGQLDENFDKFSVWELRMVVDCNAKDEELTWGREYLKAYRPDQILDMDFPWKYLWSVRSDVGYRQPDHEFFTYKDMISAGGECGPRAFFGRFICKAWGTPTWGVTQPGHAALSRWTPSGWTVCLGAAFKWSWFGKRSGPDFLEETQARNACCPSVYYKAVTLLVCIANCLGETNEEHADPGKFWMSLYLAKRKLLAGHPTMHLSSSSLGEGCRYASVTQQCYKPSLPVEPFIYSAGTITIPATTFVDPAKPNGNNVFTMQSFLGGSQLHLEQGGFVAYQLPTFISAGSYLLTARIVNIHREQVPLVVSIDNSPGTDTEIEVMYTAGSWCTTAPVTVNVAPGVLLKFTRQDKCHGLTVKDFNLQPVASHQHSAQSFPRGQRN